MDLFEQIILEHAQDKTIGRKSDRITTTMVLRGIVAIKIIMDMETKIGMETAKFGARRKRWMWKETEYQQGDYNRWRIGKEILG